ncbi:MAG: DUF4154 domain-containing protein [Deltaproteobacteria bacterium]|nr:DUF4154 domain-containing protein [Deltaproteobacteria bacterium]
MAARLLAGLLLATVPAGGLPPDVRVLLMVKVLAYHRALPQRAGPTVEIGVTWRPGDPQSEAEAQATLEALAALASRLTLVNRPFRGVPLAFRSAEALEEVAVRQRVVALYVCTGLEDDVTALSSVARRLSIATFTGSRELVRGGLGVALSERRGKPGLSVNLAAARAESVAYDAELLRVAEIIR